MRRVSILLPIIGLALPAALAAQLSLPLPTAPIGDVASRVTGGLTGDLLDRLPRTDAVGRLADTRIARLRDLVRAHGDSVEIDDAGQPAVRGRLVVTGADAATLDRARADGFGLVAEETIEGLDVQFATLSAPRGMSLTRAIKRLRKLAPNAEISADPLHEVSGASLGGIGLDAGAPLAQSGGGGVDGAIGLIDGGVARHPALTGAIEQRGFATGAPRASDHGTAVASLMVGRGAIAGPAGGVRLLAADVYGNDPAGGNATAIARALGWLTVSGVRVVTISLVGPRNPLLERIVAAAQKRGVRIVAAVGNDGPAAPPAFLSWRDRGDRRRRKESRADRGRPQSPSRFRRARCRHARRADQWRRHGGAGYVVRRPAGGRALAAPGRRRRGAGGPGAGSRPQGAGQRLWPRAGVRRVSHAEALTEKISKRQG